MCGGEARRCRARKSSAGRIRRLRSPAMTRCAACTRTSRRPGSSSCSPTTGTVRRSDWSDRRRRAVRAAVAGEGPSDATFPVAARGRDRGDASDHRAWAPGSVGSAQGLRATSRTATARRQSDRTSTRRVRESRVHGEACVADSGSGDPFRLYAPTRRLIALARGCRKIGVVWRV
jgi:hypothetical protein